MALRGIKVIELSGLAPAPFCGKILGDFGATVVRVDKVGAFASLDRLAHGKRSIALDLKNPKGVELLEKLCSRADVLIEPFRKGVMEKLGLGPQTLLAANPRLIYARLTGFGQNGPFSLMAGHDINYVAISGVLSMLGRKDEPPIPPINLLADFAGGGLMCALGIMAALIERFSSGKGQVVDAAMVEGSAYLSSWLFLSQDLPVWGNQRGENVLDSGSHYYGVYKTKDGKYMAVGCLEPQFYAEFVKRLGIPEDDLPQNGEDPVKMKQALTRVFAKKTYDEWCSIYEGTDACVTPVLSIDEAAKHPHNIERDVFSKVPILIPNPAPKLSRTPARLEIDQNQLHPDPGQHTREILLAEGFSKAEISELESEGIININELKPQSHL